MGHQDKLMAPPEAAEFLGFTVRFLEEAVSGRRPSVLPDLESCAVFARRASRLALGTPLHFDLGRGGRSERQPCRGQSGHAYGKPPRRGDAMSIGRSIDAEPARTAVESETGGYDSPEEEVGT